jgi:hypothetical protein
MHRPQGLRRILDLGSAIARLAAVVPLGALEPVRTQRPDLQGAGARKDELDLCEV